jgi:hypothetical protein
MMLKHAPVTFAATELKLTDHLAVIFRARMESRVVHYEIGHNSVRVTREVPVYDTRLDDKATLVMPSALARPMEFHGCMTVSAILVRLLGQKHQVYEGDADVEANARAIITHTARNYGVDPSEMMNHWPEVRAYLLTNDFDIPVDLLNAVRNSGAKNLVNLKGLH